VSAHPAIAAAAPSVAAHQPVLLDEAVDALRVLPQGTYLDGTFGRGGHARAILKRLGERGRLLLMDADPEAIGVAREQFGSDARVAIRHGNFAAMGEWDETSAGLDGVLLDLGVSSPQLDVAGRGFSFSNDGPLDMRMNPQAGQSAAQWLNEADEHAIAGVLWRYGEERASRRIARAIIARRARAPVTRTAELAGLIAGVMPRGAGKVHPATRSFQAIRIHVNQELAALERGLDAACEALHAGGRLVVISFHSLEDRISKQFMRARAQPPPAHRRLPHVGGFTPTLRLVGPARRAGEVELAANPRARSAVLRVAEKLPLAGVSAGGRA